MEAHHVRTTGEFINTDALELKITIQMSLHAWKAAIAQLDDAKYPGYMLASQIRDVVARADKTFYASPDAA